MAKWYEYDVPSSLLTALEASKSLMLDDRLTRQIAEAASAVDRIHHLDSAALRALQIEAQIDPSILKAMQPLEDLRLTGLESVIALQSKLDSTERMVAEAAAAIGDLGPAGRAIAEATDTLRWLGPSIDFAHLAGATFAGLDKSALGAALALEETQRQALASSLTMVTGSFERLYDDIHTQEALLSVPRLVFERPPREIFIHGGMLEAITTRPDEDEPGSTDLDEYSSLVGEVEEDLGNHIRSLSSDFFRMWRGAREASRSRNPDRIRHASASMRELVTQVLHTLAPDKDVKAWSTSPDHFDEKRRPTRQARLLFIARHINRERFSSFVDADVASALEVIDLLQKGVHTPDARFSEAQVTLLLLRVDHLLAFLLEMASQVKD